MVKQFRFDGEIEEWLDSIGVEDRAAFLKRLLRHMKHYENKGAIRAALFAASR